MPASSGMEVVFGNLPELLRLRPAGLYRAMVTLRRHNTTGFARSPGGAFKEAQFKSKLLQVALALRAALLRR